MNLGGPELVVILAVVLIVFGAGRLPDVLAQMGKGVRSFRQETSNEAPATPGAASSPAAPAPGRVFCKNCGRPNDTGAKFCSNCGQAL